MVLGFELYQIMGHPTWQTQTNRPEKNPIRTDAKSPRAYFFFFDQAKISDLARAAILARKYTENPAFLCSPQNFGGPAQQRNT